MARLFIAFILFLAVSLLLLDLLTSAFTRIGFTPGQAVFLLISSFLGSNVNIPVAQLTSMVPVVVPRLNRAFGLFLWPPAEFVAEWKTTVAINLGGAVIPILVSAYLLLRFEQAIALALIATVVVALAVHRVAQPVEGVGILTPAFWPPLFTVLAVLVLSAVANASAETRFVMAYVSGSLGTLIGADLLNFRHYRELGASVLSIGGAGTFDGIFLTGIVAVLLV